ncbi:MAG: hypothetical protein AAGF12_17250 [Myxococcota bacterium]
MNVPELWAALINLVLSAGAHYAVSRYLFVRAPYIGTVVGVGTLFAIPLAIGIVGAPWANLPATVLALSGSSLLGLFVGSISTAVRSRQALREDPGQTLTELLRARDLLVVRLTNAILLEAIDSGPREVRLEWDGRSSQVVHRVDGIDSVETTRILEWLRTFEDPIDLTHISGTMHDAIVARLAHLAKIDPRTAKAGRVAIQFDLNGARHEHAFRVEFLESNDAHRPVLIVPSETTEPDRVVH